MKKLAFAGSVLSFSLLSPVFAFAATPVCTINSFTSAPLSVNPGQSVTLTIKSTGCDKVMLYGINPDNQALGLAVEENGSVASGPVTSTNNIFTIQASHGGAASVSQSLTVGLNTVEPIDIAAPGFVENLASVFSAIGAFFAAIFH